MSTPQEQEDERVRADMQKFGRYLDSQLPYGWGFVFLAFPYGSGGRMNYISTAQRPDVVRAMYEFIDATKEVGWDKHEPELGAAAEDEQLGRARQRVAELERERQAMLESFQKALEQLLADKDLLERAANALEAWHQDQELTFDSLRREEHLIAELRKAAE